MDAIPVLVLTIGSGIFVFAVLPIEASGTDATVAVDSIDAVAAVLARLRDTSSAP